MPDAVLDAFRAAAAHSVPLDLLQGAASRIIAEATGTEAGLVTAGAAAALTLGAAAILARDDLARMERLPRCDGFPDEMIIAREQRSGYDHAVRAAGAKLVEVGFNEIVANAGVRRTECWEYEAAIGPMTAGIIYSYSPTAQPPLADVVAIAHRHKLPVIVDASAVPDPACRIDHPAGNGDFFLRLIAYWLLRRFLRARLLRLLRLGRWRGFGLPLGKGLVSHHAGTQGEQGDGQNENGQDFQLADEHGFEYPLGQVDRRR